MKRQALVSVLLVGVCSFFLFLVDSAPLARAQSAGVRASLAERWQAPLASRPGPGGFHSSVGVDAPQVSGDEHWAGSFTMSGVTRSGPYGSSGVNAMVRYGHLLYVAGSFNWADRVIASNIAAWDGTSWSPLGSGTNGAVLALAVDTGGNLYAGGSFTTAGGVTVNGIAKWNGSTWSALGSGIASSNPYQCDSIPWCVVALATDPGGNLYVGGAFTSAGGVSASNIAKWNGSAWSPLGSGMNGPVRALALDSNGYLYAGGEFGTAGGITVSAIARWGDSIWSPLGTGMHGGNPYLCWRGSPCVMALAIGPGGNLYAGGSFELAGDVFANNIAQWSGGKWSALGPGMADPYLRAVSSLVLDSGGNLVAGTAAAKYSSDAVGQVTRWNGSSWSSLGEVTNGTGVYALALDWNGELNAGGVFSTIGTATAYGIARWNGSTWSELGTMVSNSVEPNVRALLAQSGKVYVGGSFHQAGTVRANAIALWDGLRWSNLGSGMSGGPFTGKGWGPTFVYALAQDAAGHLYAGGDFDHADTVTANHVARWDGSTWSSLGEGVDSSIYALALDSSGNLYAGGSFTTAGGVTVNGIAKWNGSTWSALGSGLNGCWSGACVLALATDAGGNLYAGGYFLSAGGVSANHIAKWDGSNWSPLGTGTDAPVSALAVDGSGNLYAGGQFTTAGGVTVNCIAKWNGSTWSALGAGVAPCTSSGFGPTSIASVSSITMSGGDLYVGGTFTSAGGILANYIAKWNGTQWSALGSGTNGPVAALAVSGTDLYVGGDFWLAGGKLSENFALWSPLPTVSNSFIPVEKNQTLSFSSIYFTPYFSDVDGDSLSKIKITALPSQGTLKLGATPVVVNQEIASANLANLTYTPPTDWLGTTTFSWNGSDGTDYAASSATATLMVAVWQHTYFPWVTR